MALHGAIPPFFFTVAPTVVCRCAAANHSWRSCWLGGDFTHLKSAMAAFGTGSGGTVRRDGSWTAFRAACASGAIMLREGIKAYLAQRYMEHARVLFPIIRGK